MKNKYKDNYGNAIIKYLFLKNIFDRIFSSNLFNNHFYKIYIIITQLDIYICKFKKIRLKNRIKVRKKIYNKILRKMIPFFFF